jgi:hypothetical protein
MACRPGLIMRGRSLIMDSNVYRPPPSSLGKRKSRTPLAGPARQLWPAPLADPSHEAYVGGRRPGNLTCHTRPTYDNEGANFMPEGQRQRRPLTQIRLQGAPVRIPSKNFLAHHQLDFHFCTGFLCPWYRQHGPRVACANNGGFQTLLGKAAVFLL